MSAFWSAVLLLLLSVGRPATGQSTDEAARGVSDTVHVLLAAADVAACTDGSVRTALLLDSLPGTIVVAGDAAYSARGLANPYTACYEPTWGRHKERTHVAPGNHDLELSMMRLYFAYFGDRAGAPPGGYHAFDAGSWRVLALNSNIAMHARSTQGRWILAELARHRGRCTLAFMHHPRFSSGPHRRGAYIGAGFELLARGGVDVILSGHDHLYERFAPMRPNGARDDAGVRQFVVGTGGNGLYAIRRVARNSETRQNSVYGVLQLTLRPAAYSWEFVPAAATAFRDSGSAPCRPD